jgi:hypothetical protein
MSEHEVCQFVDRFGLEPWTGFMELYIRHFGTDQLTGAAVFFKTNATLLVRHAQLSMGAPADVSRRPSSQTRSAL